MGTPAPPASGDENRSCHFLRVPTDVRNLILLYVPLRYLPNLARTCKAMSRSVMHESHWLSRLHDLGVRQLCESHPAKAIFTSASGAVDWRLYYASYTVVKGSRRAQFNHVVDSDLCPPLLQDDHLIRSFPPPISTPGTQFVFATASSETRGTTWNEREGRPGYERGVFYVNDPTSPKRWHYFVSRRVIPPLSGVIRIKELQRIHLQAADLNTLQSEILMVRVATV